MTEITILYKMSLPLKDKDGFFDRGLTMCGGPASSSTV